VSNVEKRKPGVHQLPTTSLLLSTEASALSHMAKINVFQQNTDNQGTVA